MRTDGRIETLIAEEYEMFTDVTNRGGRAECQDDYKTFRLTRYAQFEAWDADTVSSYAGDIEEAKYLGRNLVAEKYAYMMEMTVPEEYAEIRSMLPEVSAEKEALIEEIVPVMMRETEAFMKQYPDFAHASRPVYEDTDPSLASVDTYLTGELKTYSERTLACLLAHLKKTEEEGASLVYRIYENTARLYGYRDIEDAAASLTGREGVQA